MLLATLIYCSFWSESVLWHAPECTTDTLETLFLAVKPKLMLCTKAQPGVPRLLCGCQVLQQFALRACLACTGLATGANLIGGKICGPVNLRVLQSVFCSCPALPVGNLALLFSTISKGVPTRIDSVWQKWYEGPGESVEVVENRGARAGGDRWIRSHIVWLLLE